MNKKQIWFIVPTTIIPYIVLLTLATIFFSTRLPIFKMIMECIFNSNAWYLIAFVLLFILSSIVLSTIYFVNSLCQEWDPLSLAKTAVIIKLIQIPAYVVIFVLGALLLITIFTFPFTIALFLLDFITLFLSGLISVSAIINARRRLLINKNEAIIFTILQFVFVADVISTIVLVSKLSKQREQYTH